jgi:hypothetical protein
MVYNRLQCHSLRGQDSNAPPASTNALSSKKSGELKNTAKLETNRASSHCARNRADRIRGRFPLGRRMAESSGSSAMSCVPEEAAGKKLYAVAKTGAVEVLFFIDGKPAGIYNSRGDFFGGMHSAQLICENAVPGTSYKLAFECYAGPLLRGHTAV